MSKTNLFVEGSVKNVEEQYLLDLMFPSDSEDGNEDNQEDFQNDEEQNSSVNFTDLINEIVDCNDEETITTITNKLSGSLLCSRTGMSSIENYDLSSCNEVDVAAPLAPEVDPSNSAINLQVTESISAVDYDNCSNRPRPNRCDVKISNLPVVSNVCNSGPSVIGDTVSKSGIINKCKGSTNHKIVKSSRPNPKRNIIWKKEPPNFPDDQIHFNSHIDLPGDVCLLETPYQCFKYFFCDELINKIVEETNLYNSQIDIQKLINISAADLLKYLGICVLTSVCVQTNVRDMWHDTIGLDVVKETMSLRHFEKIRRFIHFNDNSKMLPSTDPNRDKLFKLRPLINHLNKKFLTIPMNECLSIDEQVCASKIRHHLKVYMRDKPHKWGFKIFVLCGDKGFAHKFEIYSGQENDERFRMDEEPDLGASGNVVVRLTRDVPRYKNHKIYFDRYYTSLNLVVHLKKIGLLSAGTVMRNRIPDCKFPSDEILKKKPRGYSEEYSCLVDNIKITSVLFKDNNNVLFLSSFVGELPKVCEKPRYDRKQKTHVNIACPEVVNKYNKNMGNVDLLDSNVGRCHIKLKSRKWYIRLFYHLLDMTVINAWVLYRKLQECQDTQGKDLTQKEFRIELARALCCMGKNSLKRGRPSQSSFIEEARKKFKGSSIPVKDVRIDGTEHWPKYNEKRTTCKLPNCKGYTFISCEKCNVNLCFNKDKNCFRVFHCN